jgi:hypothetical protein
VTAAEPADLAFDPALFMGPLAAWQAAERVEPVSWEFSNSEGTPAGNLRADRGHERRNSVSLTAAVWIVWIAALFVSLRQGKMDIVTPAG